MKPIEVQAFPGLGSLEDSFVDLSLHVAFFVEHAAQILGFGPWFDAVSVTEVDVRGEKGCTNLKEFTFFVVECHAVVRAFSFDYL